MLGESEIIYNTGDTVLSNRQPLIVLKMYYSKCKHSILYKVAYFMVLLLLAKAM